VSCNRALLAGSRQGATIKLWILTAVLLPLPSTAAALSLQWPHQPRLAVCGSSHHWVALQLHLQLQQYLQQVMQQQAPV
jgi:hypothetical protein